MREDDRSEVARHYVDRLDAQELRGRRLDPDAGLRFGSFRHQQSNLLKANGRTDGGA